MTTEPAPTPASKRYGSVEEKFDAQVIEVEGGHLHWTGATGARGTPVVAHQSQVDTAARISFRRHYGREPVGNVRQRPECRYPRCVAGAHLADRIIRGQGGGS
ncbi:hypothetical protein [Streptomyces sp. BH104]|uniref:hypothetical protein n=1 Tax=Streptomyces sp. BH104 TaxID=3410407 RepID=UPI003BB559DB